MTHRWFGGGSKGQYVCHTSRENGNGVDAVGVGLGEDMMFVGSSIVAKRVIDALSNAYAAGIRDGRAMERAARRDDAYRQGE